MQIPAKQFLLILILIFFFGGCTERQGTKNDPWQKTEEILQNIRQPSFPENTFRLTDFGAIGDGISDNKPMFDSIISACAKAGGGKIVVSPGTYLVNGPIHLESNINLHLEEGSVLVFGDDPDYYLPVVLTSWEGTRVYNYSPFIYAYNCQNIAITGKGEIDGNSAGSWNLWKYTQDDDKALLRKMNNDDIPLEERIFGKGHYLRPHLIQFYQCENILVEGIKITDAPFWCLHFVYSENITVRDLNYAAFNYNNDGIDPESSKNILIENIVFNNRDDNIAIKAGRDREARTLGMPSENIVIRNCKFKGHNAIAIGSEMSGGVRNVFVENCSWAGSVVYGFYLKGNRDRGGQVSNIYARNLEFDSTVSTIIIDSNYKNQGSCCPPLFKNVFVENVSANFASDYGIYLKGFEERKLDSIFLKNVNIRAAENEFEFSNVNLLSMKNVIVNEREIILKK